MSKTISGKKPLSSRPKITALNEPDFFRNRLAISDDLLAELNKKNLDYRFIDYKKYVSDGNTHNRGWTVYRREQNKDTQAFLMGTNPDGIIRVGSTVLAVRPKEHSQRHKSYLAEKANLYNRNHKSSKADALRQLGAPADSVVDDVYDGNDEDDDQ